MGLEQCGWTYGGSLARRRINFYSIRRPACFNIVPKRALTLDQMAALRNLVAENLLLGTASAHDKKIGPRTWVFLLVMIIAVVLLGMGNSTHSLVVVPLGESPRC